MANFIGIIPVNIFAIARGYLYDFYNQESTYDAKISVMPARLGAWSRQEMVEMANQNFTGIESRGNPNNFLFGKIFFSPSRVDAGIIGADIMYRIEIWNSDYERAAVLSQIQGTATEGTEITHPLLPITITRGDEEQHQLTIFKTGPSIQNTTYLYNFGNIRYSLIVSGQRIRIWAWPCNWGNGCKMSYRFATAVYQNQRFYEQRRPLMSRLMRSMSADYLVEEEEMQKFVNDLRNLSLYRLAIPLYLEEILPTAIQESLITTAENLLEYWNLQNYATHVLLIARNNLFTAALYQIAALTANTITTVFPISSTFLPENALVFPAVFGIIENKTLSLATEQTLIATINFKEFLQNE